MYHVMIMGFLITIIALGLVIFIHELGHMYVAKKYGIGVHEFSIGMGPKVYSKQIKETTYSFRLLPFGGYVKLAGLDDEEGVSTPDDLNYRKKSIFHRSMVISAGSLMNLLLGFVLFVVIFLLVGVPKLSSTIDSVLESSPAYSAGLRSGDFIQTVGDFSVDNTGKLVVKAIKENQIWPMTITYQREGASMEAVIQSPDTRGGRQVIGVILKSESVSRNPIYVFWYALKATYENIKMVFVSLGMLFSGAASLKQMTGPIGIVQFASFQLQTGFVSFLEVMSMISISLGVINLFPFPVLDGGHLVFLMIEGLRKKPLSQKVEAVALNAGAFVLISLMLFIVFNDIRFWEHRVDFFNSIRK